MHLPIQNVEEAVESEAGDIVTGEVLNDTNLVEHDDLGDESYSLQPNRERPTEGPGRPASVQDAGEDKGHREECPVGELVSERVIGRAEGHLVPHEIDEQRRRANEENFHQSVVH